MMKTVFAVLLIIAVCQSLRNFDCSKDWKHKVTFQRYDPNTFPQPSSKRALGAPTFNFIYGPSISQPQFEGYRNCVILAGNIWSLVLNDAVTLNITVDLLSLGPSVLGATSSTFLVLPYNDTVNFISNKVNDPSLVYPTQEQFTANLPPFVNPNLDSIVITAANLRALNAPSRSPEASINISTDFQFDINPFDGVEPTLTDLTSVMVHEIGHMLGFVSYVDEINFGASMEYSINPLDLYRFGENLTSFSFTNSPRELFSNSTSDHLFRDNSTRTPTPFSKGTQSIELYQSSHWKNYELSPGNAYYGCMDPVTTAGTISGISPNDLRALQLIGWSIKDNPMPLLYFVSPTSGGAQIIITIIGYLFTNTSMCVFGEAPNQVLTSGILITDFSLNAPWATFQCSTPIFGSSTTLRISNLNVYSDPLTFMFTGIPPPTSEPPTSAPTLPPTSAPPTSAPTLPPTSTPPTSAPTLPPTSTPPTSAPTLPPTSAPPTSEPPTSTPPTSEPTRPPTSVPPTSTPPSTPITSQPKAPRFSRSTKLPTRLPTFLPSIKSRRP